MYPAYSNPKALQRQQWRQTWPTPILAIIATIQLILTAAIIGLESWSVGLNFIYSYAAIGYIAAFFYTITWISTFTVGRDRTNHRKQILISLNFSVLQSRVARMRHSCISGEYHLDHHVARADHLRRQIYS